MTAETHTDLTLKVSLDQLLQALKGLTVEEKFILAERLKAEATAEKLPLKKVTFTVLKTQGKPYKFNREEANER